jgi:REP element-mobilizing transposase RayT
MTYNPKIHHRRSVRLKDYDYSQFGSYFVTLCVQGKEFLFGDVKNGTVVLSPIGKIAQEHWMEIPNHFSNVTLDEFIIMPNHLHGIICIQPVGAQNFVPLRNQFKKIIPKSIGTIIRAYKSSVTHWCNKNGYSSFKWQRNFYERVIRNENELNRIREYIVTNPLKWEWDDLSTRRRRYDN